MLKATFEDRGNTGTLSVTTHFGETYEVECEKEDHQHFKLGGTAITELTCHQGVLLKAPTEDSPARFRAFYDEENFFEGDAILSPEKFYEGDACFVIEYYPLDMEGKRPGWILCKNPIDEKYPVFLNLYLLDGGGNVIKTVRTSPFFNEHRVL